MRAVLVGILYLKKYVIVIKIIGIPIDSFVFGYIGSLGEMYITESLLRLFTHIIFYIH